MMTFDPDQIADELSTLAELGIKKAEGLEEAEVFISNVDTLNVQVYTGIVEARQGMALGLGIRVVHAGKVGFAATSGIDKAKIDSTMQEAIQVAKARPLDPKFKHLPDPISISSKDGITDKQLLEFSEEEALKEIEVLSEEALAYDKRVKALNGVVVLNKGVFTIANSRGISTCSKGTILGGGVYLTAMENGKQKTGLEQLESRRLVDFGEVGSKAAQRAIKMLDSKPLGKSLRTTVVWENIAISPLLRGMFNTASSAQNVQEGRSYFKGKLNQKVADEIFTIIDDGQLHEGLSTFKTDAEGIPSQTTTLIEDGVLKSYLYDSYSALYEKRESTGNAGRRWPEPFLFTPAVSTSNLVVKTGKNDLDGLTSQVDEGILVTDFIMGAGHSNVVTGEFSVVAPNAYLIKNGEVKHPLESVTIAGNFFHSLKNVTEIGSDSKITDVGKIPSITIKDLTVSG